MGSEVIDGSAEGFAAAVLLLELLVAVPLIDGRHYRGGSGNSTRADEPNN